MNSVEEKNGNGEQNELQLDSCLIVVAVSDVGRQGVADRPIALH